MAAALTHYSDIGFVDSFKNKFQYLKELEQTLVGSKFETEVINTQQAKSYYYQLLNDVAYNFGAINLELPFNEHTILRDFELQSEKVDDLSNAINSFLYTYLLSFLQIFRFTPDGFFKDGYLRNSLLRVQDVFFRKFWCSLTTLFLPIVSAWKSSL